VSPDTIIESHGADTLRLYLMFLGPLEAMKPWNPRGIEGVHRFLQKVWRGMIGEDGSIHSRISNSAGADQKELSRLLHETIRKVGEDIEGLRFNTAISQMMIFANAVLKAESLSPVAAKSFVKLLAPFAPHIAEELWSRLGESGSVQTSAWPEFDSAVLEDDTQKIVVQVNGKRRGELVLAKGIEESAAMDAARDEPSISSYLDGKIVWRVIFVPGRILNIVVA